MIDNRDAVFRKIRDKKSLMDNETSLHDISLNEEYILDRTDVRVIFITLYSIVFVFCFIGKWSSRSRSIKLPIECQNQFDPSASHALKLSIGLSQEEKQEYRVKQ